VTEPEFLSPAWVNHLNASFADSPGSSAGGLTVQYVVTLANGSEAAYALTLGPDRDRAQAGTVNNPDVTFHMDEDTAVAISGGTLSSEEAFIKGKLSIDGDPTALVDAYRDTEDNRA